MAGRGARRVRQEERTREGEALRQGVQGGWTRLTVRAQGRRRSGCTGRGRQFGARQVFDDESVSRAVSVLARRNGTCPWDGLGSMRIREGSPVAQWLGQRRERDEEINMGVLPNC